jgi:ArsR family transcriptional regulator
MDTHLTALDRVLKALADPTRVRVLGLLSGGEVCVCHIYESLGVPQPKASRHLAYLRRAKLVETTKRGLWVYYRLAPHSDRLIQTVVDAVHHFAANSPATRRDAVRLEKRTGCCVPGAEAPVLHDDRTTTASDERANPVKPIAMR